jgi:hypothetical protein
MSQGRTLILLARPAGFEPTTPWFVGGIQRAQHFVIQLLATLANATFSVFQSQFRHTQTTVGHKRGGYANWSTIQRFLHGRWRHASPDYSANGDDRRISVASLSRAALIDPTL